MRMLAAPFFCCGLMAGPAFAQDLPIALTTRIQQGINACIAFCETGFDHSYLKSDGFKRAARRYNDFLSLAMKIMLRLQGERRKKFVRVAANKTLCEVHSDYTRRDTRRATFDLTKSTFKAVGNTLTKAPTVERSAKTVFQKR